MQPIVAVDCAGLAAKISQVPLDRTGVDERQELRDAHGGQHANRALICSGSSARCLLLLVRHAERAQALCVTPISRKFPTVPYCIVLWSLSPCLSVQLSQAHGRDGQSCVVQRHPDRRCA